MLLAHVSVGLIASRLINKKVYSSSNILLKIVFDLVVVILSILPDFDFFYLIATNQEAYSHHRLVTHTPIFWVLFGIILYYLVLLISKYLNKGIKDKVIRYKEEIYATLVYIPLFHIFADILQSNIMLLYPVSTYGFTILGNLVPDRIYYSLLSPFIILEFIIIFTSILLLYKTYFESRYQVLSKKILIYIYTTFSILLIFTISLYSITYNDDIYTRDSDNFLVLDIDNDNIIDTKDTDTDNNGVNNLLESRLNKEGIISSAYSILHSNKLTGNNILTYNIGGIDSSRLVDLAFTKTNLPIHQILKNYKNRENRTNFEIEDSKEYNDILFSYLSDNSLLTQTNYIQNIQQGDIIFYYPTNSETQNIGIVLKDNELATVLVDERWLTIHTLEVIDFTKELYLFR